MMMNFVKRAILSIKRRGNKTLLLFLTVFMLGNFISVSFAMQNTTEALKNNIKSGLGAIVTVHAKTDMNLYDDKDKLNPVVNVLEELNQDDRIKYMDYAYESISFGSYEFTSAYETHVLSNKLGGSVMMGVNAVDFLNLYQNDILLIDGRNFTQKELDEGANVIIVPEGTALKTESCLLKESGIECEDNEKKRVKVGDKITYNRTINLVPSGLLFYDSSDYPILEYGTVEYEVIGIYKLNNETQKNSFWYNVYSDSYSGSSFNGNYIPEKTLLKEIEIRNKYESEYFSIHPEIANNLSFYYLNYIQILLNNPDELNKFTFDVKDLLNRHGYYELNVYNSSDSYDAVAGSIESLSEISNMIIIVSSIVSIIILGLVTTIMIRDRKHEMGIYLSLGENKKNILLQIFLEVYLVGMLAISLSLISGDLLGQTLSEKIITYQNEKQSEVIHEKLELLGAVAPEGLEINKITEGIESNISASYVITIYLVSTLVFIISIMFPSIYILKLEPRKIML